MATPNFDLKELAAGIEQRDMLVETRKLVSKWDKTGLLRGLADTRQSPAKSNMARLLESQAGELLREANAVGEIVGFQNVAFPIVRRVFGGLIANELVSVQPMSLPSGLLFYMDYQFGTVKAGDKADNFATGGSLFGNQVAPGIADLATGGMYNFGTSFSQREQVLTATFAAVSSAPLLTDISHDPDLSASLANGNLLKLTVTNGLLLAADQAGVASDIGAVKQWVVLSGSSISAAAQAGTTPGTDGTPVALTISGSAVTIYRRHTAIAANGNDLNFIISAGGAAINLVSSVNAGNAVFDGLAGASGTLTNAKLSCIIASKLTGGTSGTLTLPEFESDFNTTQPTPTIPEITLQIQSTAVTANTRKLRARWTPELAQDLAAYQNLDAEVELTQVLSEQIALEIDREILADLLYNASGANFFWNRLPGGFLDKTTGNTISGASFTGTVREWYETLIETCIDVANNIHRKTLRGAANFMVTSPDVSTILEASVLYKPVLSMDPKETMFSVGTEKIGTVNNRFTVYKDPYFPRNKILLGFKGSSFLETGYVYAPYVPLIVTPTIYAPEDFTPRKGVMTRYAKKLVRSDFYGTVVILNMNVI
ncbi:MAG: hypothetical protein ACYDHY_07690 [Acidiferrobacterales bacterium]